MHNCLVPLYSQLFLKQHINIKSHWNHEALDDNKVVILIMTTPLLTRMSHKSADNINTGCRVGQFLPVWHIKFESCWRIVRVHLSWSLQLHLYIYKYSESYDYRCSSGFHTLQLALSDQFDRVASPRREWIGQTGCVSPYVTWLFVAISRYSEKLFYGWKQMFWTSAL